MPSPSFENEIMAEAPPICEMCEGSGELHESDWKREMSTVLSPSTRPCPYCNAKAREEFEE